MYTVLDSYVLVVLHSPNSSFQFLHPNFARDLAGLISFQVGEDWPKHVSSSKSLQAKLDTIFHTGLFRFGAKGFDYACVEVVGGGVGEGVSLGEAAEAQLCEAVANLESTCMSKQHLVSAGSGISIVGTSMFSGICKQLIIFFLIFQ